MLRWMTAVTSDERQYNRLVRALGAAILAALGALVAVTLQA